MDNPEKPATQGTQDKHKTISHSFCAKYKINLKMKVAVYNVHPNLYTRQILHKTTQTFSYCTCEKLKKNIC